MANVVRKQSSCGVVIGFAALTTVMACNGPTPTGAADMSTSTRAPGTSTSTSSASPADNAKRLAVMAYLGMWRSYAEAATTSDWRSPKLAEFATGSALSALSRGLYSDHYAGLISRGEPTNAPVVTSADPADLPTRLSIADCGDSSNWKKYHADNGQPAEGQPGGRRSIKATVEKQADGSWKVTEFGVREVGSC